MGNFDRAARWPLLRQIRELGLFGLDGTACSARTGTLKARTSDADAAVRSSGPCGGVGCAQLVQFKDGGITNIERAPRSPISRGRNRDRTLNPLEHAMDMVAERVHQTCEQTWEEMGGNGHTVARTLGKVQVENQART